MPMKQWQNFAADNFGLSTTKALGKNFQNGKHLVIPMVHESVQPSGSPIIDPYGVLFESQLYGVKRAMGAFLTRVSGASSGW